MKTPQQPYPSLAKAIGVSEFFLKREDLHAYGSHKGRSIPVMIKQYAKNGVREFVISSSGNAALAAIHATAQHNKNNPNRPVALRVFVGKKIDAQKLKNLSATGYQLSAIKIDSVDRPKQAAFQAEKNDSTRIKNLRQSTDDLALEGYLSLAEDLDKIDGLAAIFIPTSSGTTAQALGLAFERLRNNPQIHIAQTTACHPIAREFDTDALPPTPTPNRAGGEPFDPPPAKGGLEGVTSLAGAIVDNVAHRKHAVIDMIKKSNGSGWILSDEQICDAIVLVKKHTDITISANSALSVAALQKSRRRGIAYTGPVVCLITGA